MNEMDQKAIWPGWETVRLIGRGSFGAVYEIQRKVFDETEKAALKVISIPQNAGDIEEMRSDGYDDKSITSTFKSHLQSIVAEYSLMRKMKGHTNVVYCDDVKYVQHDDGFGWDIFIKMELLTPLTRALPTQIPEETVVKIGKDMCQALVVCKKHEIIHRDIKPQNIFVSENGDYKLGDFGIAKTVEKTMGGTKIGTYKYMAPEVYNNQPYGPAADQYSLGLVMYWLLNERRMPFLPLPPEKLTAGMDEQARARRLSGEPILEPVHGSEALKRIVLKACAYDPKERFASASEMLDALKALSTGADVTAAAVAKETEPAEEEFTARTVGRGAAIPAEDATVGIVYGMGNQEAPEERTVSVFHDSVKACADKPEERTAGAVHTPQKEAEQNSLQAGNNLRQTVDTPPEKKKKKPLWLLIPAAALIALAVLFATGTLGGGKTLDHSRQQGQAVDYIDASVEAALEVVAPKGATFEKVKVIPDAAREAAATQGGKLLEMYTVSTGGYACRMSSAGSQGAIVMIIGVDGEGKITGISILDNAETAGVGSKVMDNEPNDYGIPVLDQFIGMSGAGTLKVGKTVTPITGATVSTKGVTMGANAALAAVAAMDAVATMDGSNDPIHINTAFEGEQSVWKNVSSHYEDNCLVVDVDFDLQAAIDLVGSWSGRIYIGSKSCADQITEIYDYTLSIELQGVEIPGSYQIKQVKTDRATGAFVGDASFTVTVSEDGTVELTALSYDEDVWGHYSVRPEMVAGKVILHIANFDWLGEFDYAAYPELTIDTYLCDGQMLMIYDELEDKYSYHLEPSKMKDTILFQAKEYDLNSSMFSKLSVELSWE